MAPRCQPWHRLPGASRRQRSHGTQDNTTEYYGDSLYHLPLRPPGSHTPLGVGSHLRTSLHGAGLIPSAVVEGVGASAQASQPPSRSGWLVEAVILPGSTGRSPGKTAVLPGVTPGGGRQQQSPLSPFMCEQGWAHTPPGSRESCSGLGPHQPTFFFLGDPRTCHVVPELTKCTRRSAARAAIHRATSVHTSSKIPLHPVASRMDSQLGAGAPRPAFYPPLKPHMGRTAAGWSPCQGRRNPEHPFIGPGPTGGDHATHLGRPQLQRLPRCRKSALQAGGGALWVDGKEAGAVAGDSELRSSPKRSGLEQGWLPEPDGSRRGSNGSAAEKYPESGRMGGSVWCLGPQVSASRSSGSQPEQRPLRPRLRPHRLLQGGAGCQKSLTLDSPRRGSL